MQHDDSEFTELPLRPGQEPLTPEEKERFLARARAQGRALTSDEMYAIFGPPPERTEAAPDYGAVEEMAPAELDDDRISRLVHDFFYEVDAPIERPPLVRGIIVDFDDTIAVRTRPLADSMVEGARAADAYMRAAGMELPEDFYTNIIEARRFAEEKSVEEQEEHLADDAMSFLLQFFGYPTSRLDPDVLHRAVDIFYAPEMTAWKLRDGVQETLATLTAAGYKLALLTNYNCDRVFQRTVDYLNLRRHFDVCLSSASVEYRKPDLRFLQLVLDRWDCLPYETVVVGDSLVEDIRAGIELGALAILVTGATEPQVLLDNDRYGGEIVPDATIGGFGELADLIFKWT